MSVREFKINVSWLNDDKVCFADQLDPIINEGDEIVHVIEKSAYDNAIETTESLLRRSSKTIVKRNEENEKLKAQLTIAREALDQLMKHGDKNWWGPTKAAKALTQIDLKAKAVVETYSYLDKDRVYRSAPNCQGIPSTLIVWSEDKKCPT